MKQPVKFLLGIAGAMLICGYAHTAYLGFHGKSVKAFTGCLKCHND
ncbi:MAG: hypothetical protein AB1Z16_01950 [Desulfotignum sp.]